MTAPPPSFPISRLPPARPRTAAATSAAFSTPAPSSPPRPSALAISPLRAVAAAPPDPYTVISFLFSAPPDTVSTASYTHSSSAGSLPCFPYIASPFRSSTSHEIILEALLQLIFLFDRYNIVWDSFGA